MNTGTAIATFLFGAVVAIAIGVVIRGMLRGWRRRGERQAELIGRLPVMPVTLGAATVPPTRGLYVGSTLGTDPDALRASGSSGSDALRASGSSGSDALRASGSSAWLERIAVGDLGYRSKAVLTRYPEGILLERSGAGPIWIPQAAITAIRTVRGLAGKVVPAVRRGKSDAPEGILAIRWRLPSGTEIDTGFRGDDRRDYASWNQTGDAV